MLIYHQCGHNFVWNIQSIQDDGAGEGLIISPVNVEANRIPDRVPEAIRRKSWIDPQFYLPDDNKNKLATYPFFPSNIMDVFTTTDFGNYADMVAEQCLTFQHDLGFRYLVIPTRYFDDLPDEHLAQLSTLFVEPFVRAKEKLGLREPLLLTAVAKPLQLERGILRDELLSWATGYPEVAGVYLIFDNTFESKQIKHPDYLAHALRVIHAFRQTGLEVHVGYCGLEGLLLSVADPTSISVGSYENLRSFGTHRLETRGDETRRPPRPRIYSGFLLQSIPDTILPAMRQLTPNWVDYFDVSPYRDFLLDEHSALSFQKAEIYKHYFFLMSQQVAALPVVDQRADHLRGLVRQALHLFEEVKRSGVFFDVDSDESHLPAWMNALAMFEAQPE